MGRWPLFSSYTATTARRERQTAVQMRIDLLSFLEQRHQLLYSNSVYSCLAATNSQSLQQLLFIFNHSIVPLRKQHSKLLFPPTVANNQIHVDFILFSRHYFAVGASCRKNASFLPTFIPFQLVSFFFSLIIYTSSIIKPTAPSSAVIL